MISNESIGRSGEYLVAHVLEAHDIRVSYVNIAGHDLWCRTPTGRLVSVQVKTCGRAIAHHSNAIYDFDCRNQTWQPNIYAFVALDMNAFLCEATIGRRRRIRPDAFTTEAMHASIVKFFY